MKKSSQKERCLVSEGMISATGVVVMIEVILEQLVKPINFMMKVFRNIIMFGPIKSLINQSI